MSTPLISVILPTHSPDATRLRRTLAGLRAQTLPADQWELLLVDNASVPPVALVDVTSFAPPGLRIVREPRLGLTAARRCGFNAARGELLVLVDDDNVLAPDYLAEIAQLFARHPRVGACGGRSVPEFSQPPEAWHRDFFDLLALRDLGPAPLFARRDESGSDTAQGYPPCAPIGAGMALRRAAVQPWLQRDVAASLTDRRGSDLTSGGDNEIVFGVLRAGWDVAYFPELVLTHLIPAARLERRYLARLNRGIQSSWMRVLSRHGANPWPEIAGWSVPLRQLKAWLTCRAWTGPAAYVRWQGACGHFEGRRRSTVSSAR